MSGWGGRKVAALRREVIDTYGNQCWRCGKTIDLDLPPTHPSGLGFMVGHRLPRSRGGSNDIANLAPEHRLCGLSAGNRLDAPRQAERETESATDFFEMTPRKFSPGLPVSPRTTPKKPGNKRVQKGR